MTAVLDKGQGREIPDHVVRAVSEGTTRARTRRRRTTAFVRACQVASVVILLAGWEWVVRAGIMRELFVSRPSAVVDYIVEERSMLISNTVATFYAATLGFVIGSFAGLVLGIVLERWRTVGRIFDPWVTFLASLPRIALAPLFLLWFGITLQAKVVLAVSVVFFVVLVGTQAGMKSSDPDLIRAVRLLGGNARFELTKAILPGALPSIFGALRLGVIFSILGVVASEMIASREGLGQLIVRSSQELRPEGVFAMLIILGIAGTLINSILLAIENRTLKWKTS
ncbi:NitT/TauT family transport system permease protein [Rhodococcus sp. 27YEA15]|uniref:ABC transporter permease n=1 Tax=Rhodococcus sp. 27YEA15 TaxID=3156259 RepID=UPI003C79798D